MSMYTYNVEWVGDHYNAATSVTIPVQDSDVAIKQAEAFMQGYYGWDMGSTATVSVTAELVNIEEAVA